MIAALLIGRKGSVGFPGKNTYRVLGRPLCFYPVAAAKKTPGIDRIYISTDCPDLKSFAGGNDIEVIDRPDELATGSAFPELVFLHGYNEIKKRNPDGDIEFLVLLMANCVTITPEKINEGIEVLRKNSYLDSAVTVSSNNSYAPHRARKEDSDGLLKPFVPFEVLGDPQKIVADRNALGDVWFADMGVSIVRPRCLTDWENGLLPQRWMGRNIYPIKQKGGFDVDYDYEIPLVEHWLKKYGGY